MGFKRGIPATKGMKGHSWSNHPDISHRICTKCGIYMVRRTVNYVNIIEYHLNDGSVTTVCPACKGKSIYEQLMEDE